MGPVLVCHCNVVTDQQIRDAILAGAHDPAAVARSCGAGRDCLGCVPLVEQLLVDAWSALHAPQELTALQARRRQAGVTVTAVA